MPWAETIYKMVEFNKTPVAKISEHKESTPYQKEVYRINNSSGRYLRDVVTKVNSPEACQEGEKLLVNRIKHGNLIELPTSTIDPQKFHRTAFHRLPTRYKALYSPPHYPVKNMIN